MVTAEFIITTSYSIFTCILYALIGYLIIRNKRDFSGSYFNIILVDSAINVYTYINTLITIRLPRATCKDCFLAPIWTKIPGLNFFGCMYNHLGYVQYLMILSLIFNRFSAIVFPLRYPRFWKRFFAPIMVFNLLAPLVFTWPWLTVTVRIGYYEKADCFYIFTEPDIYADQNVYLVPSLIILTLLSTIIMAATFVFYIWKTKTPQLSVEANLLICSLIYFGVQLFATTIIVLPHLEGTLVGDHLAAAGHFLLPYISDGLTFSSPYILLLCCRRLRIRLKEMLLVTPRIEIAASISRP